MRKSLKRRVIGRVLVEWGVRDKECGGQVRERREVHVEKEERERENEAER